MTKRKPVEVVEEGLKPFVSKTWGFSQPVHIHVMDERGLHVVGMFSAVAGDIPKLRWAIDQAQGGKGALHHLLELRKSL